MSWPRGLTVEEAARHGEIDAELTGFEKRADGGILNHLGIPLPSGLPSFLYRTEHLNENWLCYQHFSEPFDQGP